MHSLEDFKKKLHNTIKEEDINYFLIHTDGSKAPFQPTAEKASAIKEEYISNIDELTEGINYSLACFNLDFPSTGIYSVKNSVCQVGALNEYARRKNPQNRTLTPMFSHLYKYPIDFEAQLQPCDPFDANSFYAFLNKKNSLMMHYGSGLEHTTIIHYVERIAKQLLYRYDKIFKGVVETFEDEKLNTEVIYHVRPKGLNITYDWDRLRTDLLKEGIMFEYEGDGKRISFCYLSNLVDYWLERYNDDTFYFLEKQSRIDTEAAIQKFGRKLAISDFE